MTNGIYTIVLLIMSNVFMTFAWYGHLRLQQSGISSNWPLYLVIAFSWMIAFFEYCCQVPANRIGFIDNGGPFNLVQLKVIQECISLVVFAVIARRSPLPRRRRLLRLHETIICHSERSRETKQGTDEPNRLPLFSTSPCTRWLPVP